MAGNAEVGLPPEHPTLPSLLKKVGYGTSLISKWHLGFLPKFGPLKSGYDHFFGFRSGAVDYYSHNNGGKKHDLWDQDVEVHQVGYLTEQLDGRAVEAVNAYAGSGQPFLMSLHFNAPHWPWEAPGDEAESKRVAGTNLRDFDGGTQKTYQLMIGAMDAQIGRVLAALEAKGVTENTIVIFTSDNGGERFADTWPFTGKKTELLEGGLRIPMLIAWPARIAAGGTSDQVAISMDWLPTLLAAAGAAPDPAYPPDGMDLLPSLIGTAAPDERKLFWRYKTNWQRAARIGDYKFLKIPTTPFCSTWSRIRSSAATSRTAARTSTTSWSPSGMPGTPRCCRSSPRALSRSTPALSFPTITAPRAQAARPIRLRPRPQRRSRVDCHATLDPFDSRIL